MRTSDSRRNRGLRGGLGATYCGLLALVACGAPSLDTTDESTTKASFARITESLSEEDQKRLQEAVAAIAMSGFDLEAAMRGESPDPMAGLKELNGRTGPEIIAEGERIKAELERKQREQALKELSELARKQEAAAAASSALARFEVVESRFSIRTVAFMTSSRIHLRVHNGTEHPVAAAYFLGTLATPGRAVPWIKRDFSHQIPGGLEPGERATWTVYPGLGWDHVEPRDDMVLTIDVVRLDGAHGEPLYDSTFNMKEGLSQ